MSGKVYEKHFTAEQLQNMKASTISNLKKSEESVAILTIGFLTVGFIELTVLVATLLWTNKFTLFLFIVGLLFLGLIGTLYFAVIKDYKKIIDDVKGDLKNEPN